MLDLDSVGTGCREVGHCPQNEHLHERRRRRSRSGRIEPAIAALLHRDCSIDVSCDAQYLFHIGDAWAIYPSVGLTTNDIGKWAVGLNVGGGFDFRVANNWDITAGLKWQPMFDDRRTNPVVIMVGGAYRF